MNQFDGTNTTGVYSFDVDVDNSNRRFYIMYKDGTIPVVPTTEQHQTWYDSQVVKTVPTAALTRCENEETMRPDYSNPSPPKKLNL